MYNKFRVVIFYSVCLMGALRAVPHLDMAAREEEMDNFIESPAQIKCNEHANLTLDHEKAKCINPNNITANEYVTLGAMPHMVMISSEAIPLRGNKHDRLCGGALISEKFVLASGECASTVQTFMETEKVYVRLGEVRRNFLDEAEEAGHATQVITISRVFVHPKYNKKTGGPYNIGITQLDTSAQLNDFVRPACLQSGENLEGIVMIVSNWERENGNTHTLRAGRSEASPYEECNLNSPEVKHSTFTEVCVKIDSKLCGDDATNILQTVSSEPYCSYYLVGSRGSGRCHNGVSDEPQKTFFTRITLFIPWIEKIVWP